MPMGVIPLFFGTTAESLTTPNGKGPQRWWGHHSSQDPLTSACFDISKWITRLNTTPSAADVESHTTAECSVQLLSEIMTASVSSVQGHGKLE